MQGAHLDQRIVPPIANEYRLKADVTRTGNGFGILTFDVFVENRPVVSTIALWAKLGISNPEMALDNGQHVPVEKWKVSLEY